MQKWLLSFILTVVVMTAPMILADDMEENDDDDQGNDREEMMRQRCEDIRLRYQEIKLQKAELELQFQNEAQKINLDKMRLDVDRERRAIDLACPPAMPGINRPGQPPVGPGCPMNPNMQNRPGMDQSCPMRPIMEGKFRSHAQMMKMHCLGLMLLCGVIHVILTIWAYKDTRKRNVDGGVWIVLTLLTGFLGAFLYALVRITDRPQQ